MVIGTAALKDSAFVKAAARDLPGRIVVGVDARDRMVATEGWADVSDVSVEDLAARFADAGVAALLFTDVGRDGLLKGVNVAATAALARASAIPVIASGGVAGIDDIHALHNLAKHSVLAVEVRSRAESDEELASVGARTGVGHAERTLAVVLEGRHELVLELGAVDGRATGTSSSGVTALDHEARNDAVEDDVVVFAGSC